MSVKACDRKDCANIMCDVLIKNKYVCPECLAELRDMLRKFPVDFIKFMAMPKSTNIIQNVDELNELIKTEW